VSIEKPRTPADLKTLERLKTFEQLRVDNYLNFLYQVIVDVGTMYVNGEKFNLSRVHGSGAIEISNDSHTFYASPLFEYQAGGEQLISVELLDNSHEHVGFDTFPIELTLRSVSLDFGIYFKDVVPALISMLKQHSPTKA
jgi:hypothetical protein